MARKDINLKLTLDKQVISYFKNFPNELDQARKNALDAAGKVWADGAKSITRADGHVDTSLYINSIGYNSGSPASESDVFNEYEEQGSKATLKIGSHVKYAGALEKRYNIMARAIDTSEDRMNRVATAQLTKLVR